MVTRFPDTYSRLMMWEQMASKSPDLAEEVHYALTTGMIDRTTFALNRKSDFCNVCDPRPQLNPAWRFGEVSEWLKEHAWKVCIR